ncbi:MAG TPA: hypothetical protein VL495_04420 [Edaphobacter sp.]|nr:hypothetical protein [Edaphobacter sp.]
MELRSALDVTERLTLVPRQQRASELSTSALNETTDDFTAAHT